MSTVTRSMDYRWRLINFAKAAVRRHVALEILSLSLPRERGAHPTNSLLSFNSDNFFFGAILSSTMHIYVLASAKDKRNRLVSGNGTGSVDEVAAAKEGPVFVTGGRKHSHPLITQLKWTGNVPLVHTPLGTLSMPPLLHRHRHRHYRRRHRYYNYYHYYYYHRNHDITLLSQLHCIRVM